MQLAMPVFRISSDRNPRVELYQNIRDPELRSRHDLFVVETRQVVRVLLDETSFAVQSVLVSSNARVDLALLIEEHSEVSFLEVTQEIMDAVAGYHVHRGCLALAHRTPPTPMAELVEHHGTGLWLAMERLSDPDNVGTLFRTAAALGAKACVLDAATADPLYRKAIRTSMGATLRLPYTRVQDLQTALKQLRSRGFLTVALTPTAKENINAVNLPNQSAVLIVGNEGAGLSHAICDTADRKASIKMAPGFDSLNVGHAGAIALHRVASLLQANEQGSG